MEKLREFGAYVKARELFDLAVEDIKLLQANTDTFKLRSQQIAADRFSRFYLLQYGRRSRAVVNEGIRSVSRDITWLDGGKHGSLRENEALVA